MTQKINKLITNYKRASTRARAHTYFNHIKKQVKFLKTLQDVTESLKAEWFLRKRDFQQEQKQFDWIQLPEGKDVTDAMAGN